jgi:predicted TIM-barrel fold metal-dependent hydrolase
MSEGWRDYVMGPGREGDIALVIDQGIPNPHGVYREDEFPEQGGMPGSSVDLVIDHLLDGQSVTRGVLTHSSGLFLGNMPNPHFAAEIARAANRWTEAEWLSRDTRLYGSIMVGNQLPDVAAEEIRRYADNPRFVQVLMANNGLTKPFGHPTMDPIHRAAAETGMPIALHSFSAGGIAPSPSGNGFPNYYIEYHALGCQNLMTHLVSFLVHGVFDRYPDLRLFLVEGGIAWVPAIYWRLRELYEDGACADIPGLGAAPHELLLDRVRSTTQPIETPQAPATLTDMLEEVGGDRFLAFSTDYPHWDADDPTFVSDLLPASWHPSVFYRNACDLYGWSTAEVEKEAHRAPRATAGGRAR